MSLRPPLFFLAFLMITTLAPAVPARAEFAPELAAVKLALAALLSPLRKEYQREVKLTDTKRLLPTEQQDRISELVPKPSYRCYLSPAEFTAVTVRKPEPESSAKYKKIQERTKIVDKTFRFKKDCHIDGHVTLTRDEIARVDLTLKEAGPYYRVRFLLDLKGLFEAQTGLVRVTAKIFDGELFTAERAHEADFEFLGDYTMVIDQKGGLAAPGSGSIYVKKFRRQKIDRLETLAL